MTALGTAGAARVLVALVAAALCGHPLLGVSATLNFVLNSNAIKNLPRPLGGAAGHPGSAVSAAPGIPFEGGSKYQTIDNHQPYPCAEDEECSTDEYCASPTRGASAQICLACRKLRKRCMRHAMCCPGNHCKNGICMPSDQNHFHRGEIEETIIESFGNEHSTLDGYSRRTTLSSRMYHTKGQEGSACLRSSDCAAGLCCARHFWSKICKPVLKEGQVCTKHRRKGSHGLEIFQRCYCGEDQTPASSVQSCLFSLTANVEDRSTDFERPEVVQRGNGISRGPETGSPDLSYALCSSEKFDLCAVHGSECDIDVANDMALKRDHIPESEHFTSKTNSNITTFP
ncbi:hypothetical protein E5288_WYG009049 [Bos mutus]|uniref:Uncharacterized protein n=1 Tax=Bos mutus TaxID=72004 RepID=A0A6B0QU12_9CETA|nr:hypothetical protein [Bos mutus]